MMSARNSWPAVGELIPHTGAARFLVGIRTVTPSGIVATGHVPAGHALASNGLAPSYLAIELGAQAAAAMEALSRQGSAQTPPGPRRGSIVRIRDARFLAAAFPVDTPVEIRVDLVGAAAPLAMYSLVAMSGGETVAEAQFSTHAGDPGGAA